MPPGKGGSSVQHVHASSMISQSRVTSLLVRVCDISGLAVL